MIWTRWSSKASQFYRRIFTVEERQNQLGGHTIGISKQTNENNQTETTLTVKRIERERRNRIDKEIERERQAGGSCIDSSFYDSSR